MDGLTELASPEFAAAAIERLAELIEDQPALFQASREAVGVFLGPKRVPA